MKIYRQNINRSKPFITKDSSIIRSIIDRTNAPVKNVTLAEASVKMNDATIEHIHKRTEEIYYIVSGRGIMSLNGKCFSVKKGDGILIPPGTRHWIKNSGRNILKILCACAPPYSYTDTLTTGSPYKLVIFDFDGTLADSVPSIHRNINIMAKMYGKPAVPSRRVIGAVGMGIGTMLGQIFKPVIGKMGIDRVRADYVRLYRKNHNYKMRLFPGVKGLLRHLKASGATLMIISNKLGFFVKSSCNYTGIRKYFREIIGRGELKKDKPDPYPVLYAMKKYGATRENTLFVGDSQYDAECAKRAGVRFAYYSKGYGDKKKTLKFRPYVSIKRMDELKKIT
jgi:2-phosphoglycolate phosphatase